MTLNSYGRKNRISNSKWEIPITMTLMEYFTTPFLNPHEGFVRLIRELENEIGKEKAHTLVAKVRDECARDFAEKMGGGKKYDSFDDFLKNFFPALRSQMRTSNTLGGYTEESPDCELKSIYPSCIFPEIYEKWDATDIGYLWNCMGDFAMINAFCEQAGFERPECLMLGDEKCVFCWKWEED